MGEWVLVVNCDSLMICLILFWWVVLINVSCWVFVCFVEFVKRKVWFILVSVFNSVLGWLKFFFIILIFGNVIFFVWLKLWIMVWICMFFVVSCLIIFVLLFLVVLVIKIFWFIGNFLMGCCSKFWLKNEDLKI